MPVADPPAAGEVVLPEGQADQATHPAPDDTAASPDEGNQERQHRDQVRSRVQEDLPLGQGLVHEPELPLLQVAEPTVDELRRPRRRAGGEVITLDQGHRQAADSRRRAPPRLR